MTDDLTTPLGQPTVRAPGRARRNVVLYAFGAIAIAGLAGAIAGWIYFAPQPPAMLPDAAQQVAEGAARPEAPPPASVPDETARAERPAGDSGSQGLIEVEPEGTIAPKVPVPVFRRQETALAHLPDPELIERVATGAIPRRSDSGLRPMDVYSRPPATEGNFGVARIVLIVGGLGISQTSTKRAIEQLPPETTLAFAPYGNSLARWMQAARRDGHELLLQLPMEPFDYPRNNPGRHTLRASQEDGANVENLHWAMSRITNYVGVMNFLGGKFLTDEAAMKPVFDELARRGLLLVDDGGIRNSRSQAVAENAMLPYAKADVQIDAVRDRRAMAQRLDELEQRARRTGLAIGVASAFPDSVAIIAEFARTAAQRGVELTPVSAIVNDPEREG